MYLKECRQGLPFSFKSGRISLEIHLTISHQLSIIFYLMEIIVFDIFRPMYVTHKSHVFPFPTILVLRDIWVYICFSNCCNMTSNIKASVGDTFSLITTFRVLDINPDHIHVRFRRCFNDIRLGCENSAIENMSGLNDPLNNVCYYEEVSIFNIIRYIQNLEIIF